MSCQFGTMDWYCALPAGHDGPHQSASLTPDRSAGLRRDAREWAGAERQADAVTDALRSINEAVGYFTELARYANPYAYAAKDSCKQYAGELRAARESIVAEVARLRAVAEAARRLRGAMWRRERHADALYELGAALDALERRAAAPPESPDGAGGATTAGET